MKDSQDSVCVFLPIKDNPSWKRTRLIITHALLYNHFLIGITCRLFPVVPVVVIPKNFPFLLSAANAVLPLVVKTDEWFVSLRSGEKAPEEKGSSFVEPWTILPKSTLAKADSYWNTEEFVQ